MLRGYLQRNGVPRLGVLLVIAPQQILSWSLVLDRNPEDVGGEAHWQRILRGMPWFLPPGLGLLGAWPELCGTFAPL